MAQAHIRRMSPEPYCRIVELKYPEQARPGEAVSIFCRYHNEGEVGSAFCGLWDADTGKFLGGGGYGILPPCETGGYGRRMTMPERELHLLVEVGGNTSDPRDPARIVTDSRTFTIRLAPRVVVMPEAPLLTLAPMAVGLIVAVAAGRA